MQLTHPLESGLARQQTFMRRWSTYFVIFVLAIAVVVLAGQGIALLVRPLPFLTSMNSLTALNFLFTGISFLLLSPQSSAPFSAASPAGKRTFIGWILAGIVFLIGLSTITGIQETVCLVKDIRFPLESIFEPHCHSLSSDCPWF